ncbi:transposase (fragment) [Thiomonas sp. X19]
MASGESRTRRPALAADGGVAAVGAPGEVTPQQLLRALDALVGHQDEVQAQLAGLLRPLIDQELSVVFDDRPAMGVEGPGELESDVRQVGLSKDGGIRRQFLLGVVLVTDRGRLRWETIGKGCHRRASAQALNPWSSSWAVPGRRDAERAAILEPIPSQRAGSTAAHPVPPGPPRRSTSRRRLLAP